MAAETSRLIVDIPDKQLLDWLKSRNRIPRKWNIALKNLRGRIKSVLKDYLPEELREKYPSSDNIYYFEVQDILNFVRCRQEVTGKDWLGRPKDKRLRAWEEIAENYEKDNLLLAETAQRMTQLTSFEIPQNRRDMSKQEALNSTLTKRQGDLRKKLEDATKDCKNFFEAFDMDPTLDVDLQLFQLKRKLPSIFREIVSVLQAKSFTSILKYHDTFLTNLMPNREMEDLSSLRICISSDIEKLYPENFANSDDSSASDAVQVLGKGQENIGTGSQPVELESFIDWGEFGTVQNHEQLLNDWNVEESDKETTVLESVEERNFKCSLMNDGFRKSVEADLLELKSFLEQRIKDSDEAVGNPQFMLFSQEMERPEDFLLDIESRIENLKEMLKQVNDTSDLFRGPVISRILLLRISRRYEERLKRSLQEKLQRIEKIKSLMNTCEQQKADSAKLFSEAGEVTFWMLTFILRNTSRIQLSEEYGDASQIEEAH
ncbi:hypothetical protein Gasu_23920 isoform 2 [Galdieria sulphuraria]|uniref:Uncharacterized protein n=1 Tax=Galdieria sulphuraria TaxID=130081 RepID=M2Y2R9_GALSU|nr:hypothetical protein Gasu_23920 isoform 2 [Galdieria sulphuraria]EME30238.1 hypothetical protein isoform 2 [Galdieria sulphuraria]|eukprot:XP_005706758.1 hypothetical protein isoform 2 [Galdieria sulphuraria]